MGKSLDGKLKYEGTPLTCSAGHIRIGSETPGSRGSDKAPVEGLVHYFLQFPERMYHHLKDAKHAIVRRVRDYLKDK